jgi:hypothetical protein
MLGTASSHDGWRDPISYPIVGRIGKQSEAIEIAVMAA